MYDVRNPVCNTFISTESLETIAFFSDAQWAMVQLCREFCCAMEADVNVVIEHKLKFRVRFG